MPERSWKRSEVHVGDVFTTDRLDGRAPMLYRVIGIADDPTVTLAPLYERDGNDRRHYVISSPLFSTFSKVTHLLPGWSVAGSEDTPQP